MAEMGNEPRNDETYHNHQLTRTGMEQALAEGGSVFWRGPDGRTRHIDHPSKIPTEGEIAQASGNPAEVSRALTRLAREIQDKQRELEDLQGTGAFTSRRVGAAADAAELPPEQDSEAATHLESGPSLTPAPDLDVDAAGRAPAPRASIGKTTQDDPNAAKTGEGKK